MREISSSRDTLRSTIHCCSVVSSRKRKTSCDDTSRIIQPPGSGSWVGVTFAAAGGCDLLITGMPGTVVRCVDGTDFAGCTYAAERAAAAPMACSCVTSRRLTLNRLPHCVHLTVTPCSPTLESSNSYTVMHFSQRTSIDGIGHVVYHDPWANGPEVCEGALLFEGAPVDFVDLGTYRRSESRESAP